MQFVLPNLLLVLGFCVATVGAAGFAEEPESLAWPLFLGGMLLVVTGGTLHRRARKAAAQGDSEHPDGAVGEFGVLLRAISASVTELDARKAELSSEELRRRIDDLLRNEYLDFTSRNEDWISVLGFTAYARVWDGVAVAERLLSRCWSMATDGHLEEGLQELPIARQQLERAVAALPGA